MVAACSSLAARHVVAGPRGCLAAQVLAATQTPKDKEWFQGTADAVRQYNWMLEDVKNRVVDNIIILSGDHLCGCSPDVPLIYIVRAEQCALVCDEGVVSGDLKCTPSRGTARVHVTRGEAMP